MDLIRSGPSRSRVIFFSNCRKMLAFSGRHKPPDQAGQRRRQNGQVANPSSDVYWLQRGTEVQQGKHS